MVDGRPMDGISSIKMMQGGPDYASKSHMIKWTEVFILPSSKECSENADFNEPPDPSRITSHIAKAISMALLPHLKQLKKEDLSPLAVKVCLDPENVRFNIIIIRCIQVNISKEQTHCFSKFKLDYFLI